VRDGSGSHRLVRQAVGLFVQKLSEALVRSPRRSIPNPSSCGCPIQDNEYATLLAAMRSNGRIESMLGLRGASRYTTRCMPRVRTRVRGNAARSGEMVSDVVLMIPSAGGSMRRSGHRPHGGTRSAPRRERTRDLRDVRDPEQRDSDDAFAQYFDGFSIGSNDLTQLVLGVDRDSDLVAFDYDERDRECSRCCVSPSSVRSAITACWNLR